MLSEENIRQAAQEQQNNKVYKVNLRNKAITFISGFNSFANLSLLQLSFNRICKIQNLKCLPKLSVLYLDNNEISKISGLEDNKALTLLSLNSNKIEKIQNISHLFNLKTLLVDENQVREISGIENLNKLANLSLSKNKLKSINSLPVVSKLETLNASFNCINKIPKEIFKNCKELSQLYVSNNQLTNLAFVSNLNKLEKLYADHNRLVEINIEQLGHLEYFNISNNLVQKLPKIHETFPQLNTFLFANNQVMSEYIIIEAVSEAEMLIEIDYRGNPMYCQEFEKTLHQIYGFDIVNGNKFSNIGTRYIGIAEGGLDKNEDDTQMRDLLEQLKKQVSGTIPNQTKKKPSLNVNLQYMQKSHKQIMQNEKKIERLRATCQNIFQRNGIQIQMPTFENEIQNKIERMEEKDQAFPTEIKGNQKQSPGNTTISELEEKNEENKNKWKELKNKQKNFNIRGAVRRVSGSSRKSQLQDGSIPKFPTLNSINSMKNQKPDLMRTQINPPRWNNDTNLMKTTQYRPFSASKKTTNK